MKIAILLLGVCFIALGNCVNPLFPGEDWESGFVELDKEAESLFFLYVRARNNSYSNRFVIWLNGGPGCSSLIGAFLENGPYTITRPNLTLTRNKYSWNEIANVLYIDQPVNTGYHNAQPKKECTSQTCVAIGLYTFLIKFIELHPELKRAPLYLTGECYAGKYIPAFAYHLDKSRNPNINLKGILISPSYTDEIPQETTAGDFFYRRGYFTLAKYLRAKVGTALAYVASNIGMKKLALELFNNIEEEYYPDVPNIYDLADSEGDEPREKELEEILNNNETKKILGVPSDLHFNSCTDSVEDLLKPDVVNSQVNSLSHIMNKNYTVYLLNGLNDGAVNWMMGDLLIKSLDWFGKKLFEEAQEENWIINGKSYAIFKKAYNFYHFRVFNAGHYLAFNQPLFALQVLEKLINSTVG